MNARIGRVRMKNGGADVRIIRCKKPDGLGAEALANARCATSDESPIIAYSLVALHQDGRLSVAGSARFPEGSTMTRFAFVGCVAEAAREHFITQECAVEVFNRGMGFEE